MKKKYGLAGMVFILCATIVHAGNISNQQIRRVHNNLTKATHAFTDIDFKIGYLPVSYTNIDYSNEDIDESEYGAIFDGSSGMLVDSGLRKGDVVIEVDGRKITSTNRMMSLARVTAGVKNLLYVYKRDDEILRQRIKLNYTNYPYTTVIGFSENDFLIDYIMGLVIISNKFLDFIESDDELAFLISHEFGHMFYGIHLREPKRDMAAEHVDALKDGLYNGLIKALVGSHYVHTPSFREKKYTGGYEPYKARHEFEADKFAIKLMKMAGYDPDAALLVYERLKNHKENFSQYEGRYDEVHNISPRRESNLKSLVKKSSSIKKAELEFPEDLPYFIGYNYIEEIDKSVHKYIKQNFIYGDSEFDRPNMYYVRKKDRFIKWSAAIDAADARPVQIKGELINELNSPVGSCESNIVPESAQTLYMAECEIDLIGISDNNQKLTFKIWANDKLIDNRILQYAAD